MAARRRYITGIDGLRTLAVLAVIGYHLFPTIIKGGYLGVTLFFVISGYLMTDILYQQWEDNQKIKLGLFYKRRIQRLAPSLLIMLCLCGAILLFFPHQFLNQFRGVVASSLFYYNNWWQILHGVSYFEQFGQAMPFVHLWSLSVEGQFYLLWPIIMGLMFFKNVKPKIMIGVTAGLSIISAIEMAVLYNPQDLNRVYYGTDTRLFALMLGCLLAVVVRAYSEKIKDLQFKYFNLTGISLLVILIPCMIWYPDNSPFVYRGGMYLYSLICMLVLGLVVLSENFNALLTNKFFHWIGTRSYEIYLWQYPVLIVYETTMKLGGKNMLMHGIIELVIILLLSELTYHLVKYYRHNVSNFSFKNFAKLNSKTKVQMVISCVVVMLFTISFVIAPNGKTETTQQLEQALQNKEQQIKENSKPQTASEQTEQEKELVANSKQTPVPLTLQQVQAVNKLPVTAIGDSVLLDAAPDLQKFMPEIDVNAEVGRQLKDSISIVEKMKKENKLAKNVIISLGTNGHFENSELKEMLNLLKGHQVYLVNVVVPKSWQEGVNRELESAAKKYKNVHLINWYGLDNEKDEWFFDDGTHMNEEGSVIYAEQIVKDIANQQKTKQ